MRCRTPVFSLVFVALLAGPGSTRAADSDAAWKALGTSFKQTVAPFMKAHCLECHNPKKVKGGVDLEVFGDLQDVMGDFATWQAVLDQVRSGEMPPEDAPAQPTAESRKQIAAWIEAAEAEALRRNANDPGVVLLRRLSHQEYDNTIRDLTGVDIKPASSFPVDPTNTAGFDNSGTRLESMKEGDRSVLDNACLLFTSNMWSGSAHNSSRVPLVTLGSLGGTIPTGKVINYMGRDDDKRKLCSLYLSLADRMLPESARLSQFGDATERLAEI